MGFILSPLKEFRSVCLGNKSHSITIYDDLVCCQYVHPEDDINLGTIHDPSVHRELRPRDLSLTIPTYLVNPHPSS